MIVVVAGVLAAPAGGVRAQGDPLDLQKRAVARIDAVVEMFRRSGDTRLQISELRQADAELAASNRALAARQEWPALALGLIKQGHVYRLQAQWAQAVALYTGAADAASRGADAVRRSDALAWRALAESSRQNLGQAFADASEAVRLAETTTDKDVLARALDVLGSVQIAQLDLTAAAETIAREVDAAAQAPDRMASYYALLNRSDVYLKLASQCDYNRNFAGCYQALDRAQADLERAAAIVRTLGYAGLVGQTEQFLRDVATRRALVKSQEAQQATVAGLQLFQPQRAGDVLVTDRFIAPATPVPPALVELQRASRQQQKQLGGFADIAEARTHFVEGLLAEMQGNNDAALTGYMNAVSTLERDRRSLRDERSRGTFLEDRIGFYYAAVLQLLERRRFDEAFELLERSRARALADLMATRDLGLRRPEEQRLYAETASLRTQIGEAQARFFELASRADAGSSGTRLEALAKDIRTLEGRHQQVLSRIAVEAPHLQQLVDAKPVSLAAVQQAMRDGRFELIQYLVLEHAVVVWHVAADKVTVRSVFLPRAQVASKVAALQKSLADRNAPFDRAVARELFLFLVAPVLPQVRAERLVVIPHEDLNHVPFQVFQDPADGRFFGERFDISYAPSASVQLALKPAAPLAGARLVGFADPSIVAAPGEVGRIQRLFPGRSRVVTDALARESDVKSAVRDYDVVHLSVHGRFNAAEPMLSYLALAPGNGDDGRLTAAEMFGLPLDGARLVVLSACETGRVEATHGNEVMGLVRALLYAGAGNLILSYWQVDSEATAVWMQAFYEAAVSRPLAEAARVASLRVRNTPAFAHPYYWAAFAMVGR